MECPPPPPPPPPPLLGSDFIYVAGVFRRCCLHATTTRSNFCPAKMGTRDDVSVMLLPWFSRKCQILIPKEYSFVRDLNFEMKYHPPPPPSHYHVLTLHYFFLYYYLLASSLDDCVDVLAELRQLPDLVPPRHLAVPLHQTLDQALALLHQEVDAHQSRQKVLLKNR